MSMTSVTGQPWVYLDVAHALEQIGDEQAMRSMLPMLQELLERDLPPNPPITCNGRCPRGQPAIAFAQRLHAHILPTGAVRAAGRGRAHEQDG